MLDNTLPRLPIAISACLLGFHVRYDGASKRYETILRELSPFVEWVPVCPEVGIGMSVPREALHLVRRRTDPSGPRLVTVTSRRDYTATMLTFAEDTLAQLAAHGICGYIFKSKSPSCGLHHVPVFADDDGTAMEHADNSTTAATGMSKPVLELSAGLFAQQCRARFPDMPMVDENSLATDAQRAQFLERARAYGRGR